jgi:hypothetical protein
MQNLTQIVPQMFIADQTEQHDNLATRAKERLLNAITNLSRLEQNREAQKLFLNEGWKLWQLGGFCFSDGSVLLPSSSGWWSLSPTQAQERLEAQLQQPLEIRLFYAFMGSDQREKCTVTEARLEFDPDFDAWRLAVEYETYMNSPLYGFETSSFQELLELNIWDLRLDTRQSNQRWRLERVALHSDWLELLHHSRAPD